MKLKVDGIRLDGKTQIRLGLGHETLDRYCELMKEGVEFPPVVVFDNGESLWLADGFHRVHAARNAGLVEVEADVREGDRRDALRFALTANDMHGLPPTNADKRNGVLLALEDQQWRELSNYELAKMCAVSEFLVRKIKSEQKELYAIKSQIVPPVTKPDAVMSPQDHLKIVDEKVKARTEPMREEYERREAELKARYEAKLKEAAKPAVDPAEIERRAAEIAAEQIAAAKLSQQEAAAKKEEQDREHQRKLEALEQRRKWLEENTAKTEAEMKQKLDDAARAGLDVQKITEELQERRREYEKLGEKIEEESENLTVRGKLRKVHESVLHVATLMDLAERKVAGSANCCGLSIEEMESFIQDLDGIATYTKSAMQTFNQQIEKMRKGGGLRVV